MRLSLSRFVLAALLSAESTAQAQAPQINLADISAGIDHGAQYHICGTVVGIPDGEYISIAVLNGWNNSTSQGEYSIDLTAEVIGGAFYADAITFYGFGSYDVTASGPEDYPSEDTETGIVFSP